MCSGEIRHHILLSKQTKGTQKVYANKDMKHDLLLNAKNTCVTNFAYSSIIYHTFIIHIEAKEQQRILKRFTTEY